MKFLYIIFIPTTFNHTHSHDPRQLVILDVVMIHLATIVCLFRIDIDHGSTPALRPHEPHFPQRERLQAAQGHISHESTPALWCDSMTVKKMSCAMSMFSFPGSRCYFSLITRSRKGNRTCLCSDIWETRGIYPKMGPSQRAWTSRHRRCKWWRNRMTAPP